MQQTLIISAANLSLNYGKEKVLEHANFNIFEGEFVFLTGKSGSGKTTLLRALYGDFRGFSGDLYVLGKDMHDRSHLQQMRRKMGIIFQDYRLINELNVQENIALPLKIAGFSKEKYTRQTEVILKYIQLAHKAKSSPNQLSGGEQQRVALGRAIIANPRLIICDEPTGNLDNHSAEIIFHLLAAAQKSFGASVIVATHHIPSALGFSFREIKIESGSINA